MIHFIASLLLATSTLPPQEQSLTWTPEVMMQTQTISNVQLSPDNTSFLFVAKEQSLSRIYKGNLGGDKAIPFSASNSSATSPKWSPDGRWVAYLSDRNSLYLMPAEGEEAVALTEGKKGVQHFSWSPDSSKIAFIRESETEEKKDRPYIYGQETMFNQLWTLDISSKELKALTTEEYCIRGKALEFDWSPDSKEIVFAYTHDQGFDSYYIDGTLATVDVTSGKITPWEKKGYFEALPRYSPDGKQVAYLFCDTAEKYSFNRYIAIRSKNGKEHRLLAKTFNEGPFLFGPNLLGWSKEGDHLLFFEPKGTKYHLVALPIDGTEAKTVDTGDIFFTEPTLSQDRTTLGFIAQTPSTPPEAYIANLDSFDPVQVSNLNESLLAYPKIRTELIYWNSFDGTQIEGLLTYPVDYEKGRTYPLLLFVHGGPAAFFAETFVGTPNAYPLAAFAESGYFIFRPNPRGSCGYGKQFRCANYNDWGGADFDDILSGVDALIAKGIADPEKLGIMGWSYGGYMTAWAITQTTRFKAASMGGGPSNLVSMNGTTDLHHFLTDYLGDFTNNRSLYEERSPINHVQNVRTPCLIQHGMNDIRLPVSQSYEFYHALKRVGQKPTLILYPGMGHSFTDPIEALDLMERNLEWFNKHLKKAGNFENKAN